MTYPTEITEEILQKNAHITDEHIQKDIADTQAEVATMQQQAEGYRLIANANPSSPDGKMAYFRQTAAEHGIAARQTFIAFLEALLKARRETAVPQEAA
jgi:hypothetical protein